jgi:hypothetical protein
MRPFSVPELLTVWEHGLGALPWQRALTILSAANPHSPPSALARVSIGRRDTDLLQLREWAFGKDLTLVASCPACQQTLEFTLPAERLRGPTANSDAAGEQAGEPEGRAELHDTGQRSYELRFRPVNSEDIAGCAGLDVAAATRKLLSSCVLQARRQGESVSPQELPDEVVQQLLEQLAASDPQADRRIELTCPECHENWSEVFDIVSFFWTEIDVWARRTLREVNVLARAYGWHEDEILGMSPLRRQIYLAMAQA